MGASKKGPLDVDGGVARGWLATSGNPNGRPNSDVIRPLWNSLDVARRPRDMWVIDFGTNMPLPTASLYEAPFKYVETIVKPSREKNGDPVVRQNWWRIARSRPEMRSALNGLPRYIATPAVAKHRIFTWVPSSVLPDQQLLAIARSDDATFGVLHSRFHELWALALCTFMGVGNHPRYTPTTVFETFPFPSILCPKNTASKSTERTNAATIPSGIPLAVRAKVEAVADAAARLVALRDEWLNPSDWIKREHEIVDGFPDRILPIKEHEAALKKRTLTNLYNQRPTWLERAHAALDDAVASLYGWSDYSAAMQDDEILARLFALNLQREGTPGESQNPCDHIESIEVDDLAD